MLAKRIIPCLDIKNGRTVKGIHFEGLRDAGDPIELAKYYSAQGADELVFLDITATQERREPLAALVRRVAEQLNIPFTVGGGIRSVADVEVLLRAGADKVSINSAALQRPKLIQELAAHFGQQCIVVAVDARPEPDGWRVYRSGGKIPTAYTLFDWAQKAQDLGAGELLFTSMAQDGTKQGFANKALAQLHAQLYIPVIASGGAGTKAHFAEAFINGKADAALAASVFHFREIEIPALKSYLQTAGVPVRPA